jgi:3-isopropylmalate dehydrogenase
MVRDSGRESRGGRRDAIQKGETVRKNYKIGIMPGDGIGRDVIRATMPLLEAVNDVAFDFTLDFNMMDVGDSAVEKYGDPFPEETVRRIGEMNAVLFGAAGGPNGSKVIQGFRRAFDLYANIRPIKACPGINAIQPKADIVIVRENTEGLYRRVGYIDGDRYVNLRVFTKKGMERIIRASFSYAVREGRRKVTFTHKTGLLTYTDLPMRELFYQIALEYKGVEADDLQIDNCAMRIITKPETLDVVLAENANGDILSDVGAAVIGGLGFVAGGNIGDSMAVFEPIHGSAPKHADKNIVNPIAAIMAARMMIHHLGEKAMASKMEQAVSEVLLAGKVRTYDIGGTSSTTDVGEAIAEKFHKLC